MLHLGMPYVVRRKDAASRDAFSVVVTCVVFSATDKERERERAQPPAAAAAAAAALSLSLCCISPVREQGER